MRRIVSNMPFFLISGMIEYKAAMLGIPVVSFTEQDTSKTCHSCSGLGNRKTQGLFRCSRCGERNADWNGAINIGKKFQRAMSYMPIVGASCEQALNGADEWLFLNHGDSPEATQLVGW